MIAMNRVKPSLAIIETRKEASPRFLGTVALFTALSTLAVHAKAATNELPLSPVNGTGVLKASSFNTYYNFGPRIHGLDPTINHDFVLQNKTKATVYLDKLAAGCSCTTLHLDGAGADNTIAPGAKVTEHMSHDEKQLPQSGLDKIAWLYIKGRTKPVVAMHMTGSVRASLTYLPAIIQFGDVSAETTKTVPLKVRFDTRVYGSNPPDVKVDGALLTAKRTGNKVDAANKLIERTYDVKLNPAGHLGRFDGGVYVPPPYNKDGGGVFVIANIVGSIAAEPRAVAFMTVMRGQTTTKQLVLKGLTPTALAGLKVGSDSQSLTAKVVKHSGKSAVVDVSVDPSDSGPMLANVLVSTANGQTLKVLVSAYAN